MTAPLTSRTLPARSAARGTVVTAPEAVVRVRALPVRPRVVKGSARGRPSRGEGRAEIRGEERRHKARTAYKP